MKRESGPTLTALDLGQLEIIEDRGIYMSTTALLTALQTRRIPLIDPPRLDERRFCRHAIDGAPASEVLACPCLQGPDTPTPKHLRSGSKEDRVQADPKGLWCSLNGSELRSPCVFLEPPDAPVWVEIRAYAERWGLR
jgi:hypothetical protein